ncbi:DNA translocase FtsK [Rhizobium sp. Pop5]|uniref:DNA translocase FtsK n=3 Tax=Rhizobium sp. Pop5 TaxID=1223565 RepID=UPI002157D848|nr:DNA translocase FtsK [Rhizobium sp. Pop5]UVD56793.1 DNA translocase FtsK [Rhizobium sp. Pop5]
MRFPRTNLTDAADFSSGLETEIQEEIVGEKPAAPIWQSNFSLAPNVRFTRTPETLISKRRAPNEPARDDSQIAQQAIRIEPVAVDVPFDIYLPEADEIPAASVQMVEPQQLPLADRTVAPSLRAASELSSISDFAFWEVMAFEEGEPIRTPAIVLPKIETTPESITSLFRVMEWRPGAPKHAPAASRPVQPAVAAPARPAVRPPAAISRTRPEAVPEAAVAPAPRAVVVPDAVVVPPAAIEPPPPPAPRPTPPVAAVLPSPRLARPEKVDPSGYEFPPRALLQEPPERLGEIMSQETLEQNAGLLESVLEDFGIKGEIIHVRPGPVVTLYEFEPAPGVKSSRVIGLADDIARSMSALSARVAVVPGRNVIGIELPNVTRETVYFREMIESDDFEKSGYKLALGLGKTIGGEPVIAELAKMPHLLVAGTTGSGKSVAINTMILSLLYRMTPEQCRLIMVDPKMLELSVYDGIPHLLTPVVTDPKKAVMALKWAVREMEERYRKMSRLGVRNIDGYNGRVSQAREKGETIHIMVQVGFDRQTGAPIEESQELDLAPMPYIVVIVDEMADLMMVAGKEIEGAIQRLAQMARAAGIHLIMATQRPSVDVITGTIKANFPTRISFQVTSKIDSRTILGEQGAEQLLGQGDMLHMQGGGRIARVHGPFVSDLEVEKVVAHLKTQGRPEYLDTVTADEEEEAEEEEAGAVFDKSAMASEDGNELYEQAVKVVMRDKKCSTSYIQRRLGIGYNRAASLVERMEKEGLVGPANHVGKREIVSGRGDGD